MLLHMRGIMIKDPITLLKWHMIVDSIVKSEPDKLRIKTCLGEGRYEEAVLQTLNIWNSSQGELVELITVLQCLGLNSVAGKLKRIPRWA